MIEFPSGDSFEDECILRILNLVMDEIEVYHGEAALREQSNPLSCPPALRTTSVKTGHKSQAAAGGTRRRHGHPAPARLPSEGCGGRLLAIRLSLLEIPVRPPTQ